MALRPLTPALGKRLAAIEDRRMTYIAAFPCREGYVCCADTLETVGKEKQYVEKLSVYGEEEIPYPFCIGGAGAGELIDALTQEISERLLRSKPQGCKASHDEIKAAVAEVYAKDVPVMALKRQHRTPELLIAVNSRSNDTEFCLFHVKGRRVYRVERGIIGYTTAVNQALLKRLHDAKMPMSQAVMLAVYLVSQSKLTDDGVEGDTRVAVVSQFSAQVEEKEYIESIESRMKDFLPLADLLFLHLGDVGISNFQFDKKLKTFVDLLQVQRKASLEHTRKYIQFLVDTDKLRCVSWPYSKIPLGTKFQATPDPSSGRSHVSMLGSFADAKRKPMPSDSETSKDQR